MSTAYTEGLKLVKLHDGTSGQTALAKCILSVYNPIHAFSIGEILGPLDDRYTAAVIAIVKAYAQVGETEELRRAGEWVYENFPGLVELSEAQREARAEVRRKWDHEREEEARRLYPNG
ncbi:hypothetical protein [Xanthomonas theicola]|uniref:Uncharacterized protein n=1 Tax=Xanthomonas theicola TaxID=56464 RepID=A0A2S6ZGL5_9XANT|nr:hypothetical protein [Xanthomonas theicola]PPT91393.1 hypothetical protein XthCFBP4691_07620 [Xanthomonas theicola]QNH27195.1 hypothetical protein G4Q83_22250 [Xanthomonas theicola]